MVIFSSALSLSRRQLSTRTFGMLILSHACIDGVHRTRHTYVWKIVQSLVWSRHHTVRSTLCSSSRGWWFHHLGQLQKPALSIYISLQIRTSIPSTSNTIKESDRLKWKSGSTTMAAFTWWVKRQWTSQWRLWRHCTRSSWKMLSAATTIPVHSARD